MTKSKRITLEIGSKLYKYIPFKGTWEYEVIGKREYAETVMYDIECKHCNDHTPCRVLVNQVDNCGYFEYVSMLNNNDNEDEENYTKDQYYWHVTDTKYKYFTSKNKCLNFAYTEVKKDKVAELEEAKKRMKNILKSINEMDSLIKGFVDDKLTEE